MAAERSHAINGRSALTALATAVGLLLFIGASVWLYDTFGALGQNRDEAEAARAKQLAVQARNQAVLEGREPGTQPFETALQEFLARQQSGQPTFPLPPTPPSPPPTPPGKGPDAKQPATQQPAAKTPDTQTPGGQGEAPPPGDAKPMRKEPKADEPSKALAPGPRDASTPEPVTTR